MRAEGQITSFLGFLLRGAMPSVSGVNGFFEKNKVFPASGVRNPVPMRDLGSHNQVYMANSIQDWGGLRTDEAIISHLQRRVHLFFHQAVLCYDVPYLFEHEGVEDQLGNGTGSTQGAHASTLPCLRAFPIKKNGEPDREKEFVYLKYSQYYYSQNSTEKLPIWVNKTDTLLDGTSKSKKLRSRSIQIINACARGKLNPVQATGHFVQILGEELKHLDRNLGFGDERKHVAQIYLKHLDSIRDQINNCNLLDLILGVKIPFDNDSLRLRDIIVYPKLFKLMQASETAQSKIAYRIVQKQKEILSGVRKTAKKINFRLQYQLLKNTKGFERRCLEKLFCTSIPQLRSDPESKEVLDRLELKKDQRAKLHKLVGEIRKELKDFHQEEKSYRADLLHDLRKHYRDWGRDAFAAQFKAVFPKQSMNKNVVKRLETPEKEIPVSLVIKIAKVLGVHPELFYPPLAFSKEIDLTQIADR